MMLTATVQFCGAGGTSEAARQAGIAVDVAINHSSVAIATHKYNHPGAWHIEQSMEECDPDRLPASDFLLASPCCTNHSIAKGQKQYHSFDLWGDIVYDPLAERSRNTMYDVVRFAAAKVRAGTPYAFVVVENVVEVVRWRCYQDWLAAMTALGYAHQVLYWNTQFFGVPQSRDRVYLVFWQRDLPQPDLVHTPLVACPCCGCEVRAFQSWKRSLPWGRYGQQYVYRCSICRAEVVPPVLAAACVVKTAQMGASFEVRSLSPRTMERVRQGRDRFGGEPFFLGYYKNAVYRRLVQPLGTVTTLDRWALVTPGTPFERSCLRMLTVQELKAVMGFSADYHLLGSAKEQVWMLGNAVCPPLMVELLRRCVRVLEPGCLAPTEKGETHVYG